MKKDLIIQLSFFAALTLITACNATRFTGIFIDDEDDLNSTFSGVTSLTGKTDSTITLHWVPHADATSYDILLNDVLHVQVNQPSDSHIELTGLTPGATYKFRIHMKDALNQRDSNKVEQITTMNATPNVPTPSLLSPASSPSLVGTPAIRVSNVKDGDIITLYSDAGCNTLIATQTADSSSIDMVTNSLTTGTYAIAARAANPVHGSAISACSSTTVAYNKVACPTSAGDFILVPGNSTLGTTDFCIAKYEMKMDTTTAVVVSAPDKTYLHNTVPLGVPNAGDPINYSYAKSVCQNLGANFHLINNPEWMTTARNIEQVDSNWSTNVKGTGQLSKGWAASDNLSFENDGYTHTSLAPQTDSNCLYHTGPDVCSPTGDSKNKRTHLLSTGEEVWDLAGNLWEFVDWEIEPTDKAYSSSTDPGPADDWRDWTGVSVIDTRISSTDVMKPETWASAFITFDVDGKPISASSVSHLANNIGAYYAGAGTPGGPNKVVLRSGNCCSGSGSLSGAGIFTLAAWATASTAQPGTGFRCVYSPNRTP